MLFVCRNTVAYIQQQDCHVGTSTVREALRFSAELRLPSEVSPRAKVAMVEEVLDLLQLRDVADALVGDADYSGLSPSQLKRLTIGLELVTNPSILLADGEAVLLWLVFGELVFVMESLRISSQNQRQAWTARLRW